MLKELAKNSGTAKKIRAELSASESVAEAKDVTDDAVQKILKALGEDSMSKLMACQKGGGLKKNACNPALMMALSENGEMSMETLLLLSGGKFC